MPGFSYEALHGFFVQDSAVLTDASFEAVPPRLGLIDDTEDRWSRFKSSIDSLNASADARTRYKVIIFGRHGQGYHNVAESKYGTKAWDDYWSKLKTDGELVWGQADPLLTPLGEEQARTVYQAWRTEAPFGVPLPEKLYCSPLTRALRTNQLTFEGIFADGRKTIVVENCRETFADHTCDQRRSKTYIHQAFPDVLFEEGFSEEDVLWTGSEELGETFEDTIIRAKKVLDTIFEGDKEIYISITGHGGIINGFLKAMMLEKYGLPTGGVLPLVIKATQID